MARTLDKVLLIERGLLDDATTGGTAGTSFTDAELELITQQIVEEVSQKSPNIVREVFLTFAGSRELDISGIDMFGILNAEYPVGEFPRKRRNTKRIDNTTIEIDTTIEPSDGDSGTLDGTVTFTSGSTAVTGSGTAFSTYLSAGYHIRVSDGTRWYRIASVTDATNLVLAEVCRSDDTGADIVDSTIWRDGEVAYLFCKKNHTLTDSATTLDPDEEKVVIDGSVALAAQTYVNTVRENIKKAKAIMISADTAILEMSGRLNQALADLVTGRAQIADERTASDAAIDKVSARILAALDDLELGRTFINKVNYGGNPEGDYGAMATKELNTASEYMQQARAYMDLHSTSGRYGDYSGREIALANGNLAQAGGNLRQANSYLSLVSAVNTYQTWANGKQAIYQRSLRKVEKSYPWYEFAKG